VGGVLFNQTQATLIQYPPGKAGGYTIPNNVTSIGDNAFDFCPGLTSVIIPSSVTSIGTNAFYTCTSLTNVIIGSGVSSIASGAFYGCTKLASFPIGTNVVSIGSSAFTDCSSLTSITILNNVTNIGSSAFLSCSKLNSVTIANGSIGSSAFQGCTSLTNVIIGSGVSSIGSSAFQSCTKLASVTIANGSIGSSAFQGCTGLIGVYFRGNAPTNVGSYVFSGDANTVYYVPGTTNWGSTFAGRPAVLWNPLMQATGPSFGVHTNQFGFNITGSTNIPIVVEACTNLTAASWTALKTCTLTNGLIYFRDSAWSNYPARFYRVRSP
jgi:hypothetical protein